MSKITIMKGLPASGKSTLAKELLKQGGTVRLNKDLLRTMLHDDKFNGKNEDITGKASRLLAEYFLTNGINVIIDDTNLNQGVVQSWKDLAKQCDAKIEYKELDTPITECIERDEIRSKRVGSQVIKKMALQHMDYLKGEKVVICDLDGTLCDIKHRLHYLDGDKKDWSGFFGNILGDSLRQDVWQQVSAMCADNHARLIFVSARPEGYRGDTEHWFGTYGLTKDIDYELLIMRNAGDSRDDTIVKSDIYDKYLKNLNVIGVFDDRPKVIRMWREKGLNVIDVGEGVEF